jgi:hypothetical protein
MIIGHVGVAFGAKWRWQRLPLGALLVATFAPDILREVFAAAGLPWRLTNFYSHALPWSALLAMAAGALAWKLLHGRTAGFVVFGVVLSHIALDMISGSKPLWSNGPAGLDLGDVEQVELIIEAGLCLVGWYLVRRASTSRFVTHWALPVLLIVFQAVVLLGSISRRPYATRCLASPFGACTDASWLTQRWNTTPFW